MSLVEQVQWPEDVPFTGIPVPNFEAGVVSDITAVRIFNDRNDPATGSVLKDMHFSVANLDPDDPSIRLTSGIAPMDQLWPEVRFVDASTNIELHVTEWIRIGASSIITFPSMIADSWRQLEIRYRPPSYALTNPYTFFFFVHVGERAFGVQGPSIDVHRGVISSITDKRKNILLSGSEVLATDPTPDDFISVQAGTMAFQGLEVILGSESIQVDDLDGTSPTPEALEIGESYFLMLSRNKDGTVDETKSVRDASPVKPSKFVDKIFLSYVLVNFQDPLPVVIDNADIEMTTLWSHYYLRHEGLLVVRMYGGDLLSSGTWRTTFEFEDFTLTASEDNYIWSRVDGTYTVTLDATLPDGSSDLLWKVTTDSTTVTAIESIRVFVGDIRPREVLNRILSYNFGGDLLLAGDLALVHGTGGQVAATTTGPDTTSPIPVDGNISRLSYSTATGDNTTQVQIYINGVIQSTVTLLSAGPITQEIIPIKVLAGDFVEIDFLVGTVPGVSIWSLLQDPIS